MKKSVDHLTTLGHKVADLEQIKNIQRDGIIRDGFVEYDEFETWCCVHRNCNYLEFRLKEGHREDR